MSVSFEIGFSSETKVEVHASSGLETKYHSKKEGVQEFIVVECYDPERKTRVRFFVTESAIDALIEKIGVIGALRFKS